MKKVGSGGIGGLVMLALGAAVIAVAWTAGAYYTNKALAKNAAA